MDVRNSERRNWIRGAWMPIALAAVLAVTGMAGCRHRRSSLRPVFVGPSPVLTREAPETIISDEPELGAPIVDSAPAEAPAFQDDFGASSSPPASPAPSSSSGSSADEPDLEPVTPRDDQTIPSRVTDPDAGSSRSNRPSGLDPVDGPEVLPPQARRNPRPTGATRLTSRPSPTVRQLVQERADDPIDLVQPPKADKPWRYIVIHHSADPRGGYAQLDRAHREKAGLTGCGYHFVIGNGTESPDGTIEVTRRWSDQKSSQHCRDAANPAVNESGIAICLIGDFDQSAPTRQQVETTRLLVRYLQDRYSIPSDRVITHADSTTHAGSSCPGKLFPMNSVVAPPPALTRR